MTTLTTNQGLILAAPADGDNVPQAFSDYNGGVENRLVQRFLSALDRLARDPLPNVNEISGRADAPGQPEVWNGTAWVPVAIPTWPGVSNPAVTSGTDTTASNSFANMAGTGSVTSFSVTKNDGATKLRIDMSMTCFSDNVNTGCVIGVRINAVDTTVARTPATITSGIHFPVSGFAYVTGLAAGVYTVQARWARAGSGPTGTLTRDSNDWLAVSAIECR